MHVGMYVRVSTDEQVEHGYSLDAQERACRDYATSRGWTVQRFADEAISGCRSNRPGLLALRAAITAGQVKGIIVHKLDRLARDLHLSTDIIKQCQKHDAIFISISEQLDFSTPMGWAMFQIAGVFNELYSRNLSFETKKGRREKARQGGWVGPLPIGYKKTPQGTLVPSDDAVSVRLIFDLYATRQHSYSSIADELNARGFRTNDWQTGNRGRFERESIRTILRNRAYIGEVFSVDTHFPGLHEPLVTKELWELIAAIREERTSNTGSSVRACAGWLLTLCYCTKCGNRYHHHLGSNLNVIRYYRCSGIPKRVCNAPMARAERIEGQVLDVLREFVLPQQYIPEIIAEAQRLAKAAPVPEAVPDTTREITERLALLKKARDAHIIKAAEYKRQFDQLMAEHTPKARLPFHTQRALERLEDIPRLLEDAVAYERLALMKSLFEKIWIEDRRIVKLTPRAEVGEILASALHVVSGVPNGSWGSRINSVAPYSIIAS